MIKTFNYKKLKNEINPILTVIIVVFNNKKYIELAIQNYLEQECSESELLIVDGASTDGTVEIIKEYALKFPTIRWVSEKDKGQSDAMNKSLKLAYGKYISFLNVDDFYSKGALKEVVSILCSDDKLDFIVGNCNVWDAQGNLFYVNRPRKMKSWHLLSGYYLPVNPTAYFYKKEIHQLIGGYSVDNHFNMDIEFLIEASLAVSIVYYPKDWGNFRLLPNTKTVSDQENGLLEQRKQELFDRYLAKVPIKIKILTIFTKGREYFIRKVIIKSRWIYSVFYFKIKKILNGTRND